MFSGSFWT